MLDLHQIARHQTFILASPNLKKGVTFEKFCNDFWSLPTDEKKSADDLIKKARQLFNGNKQRVRD
jgi:hypothetical protein